MILTARVCSQQPLDGDAPYRPDRAVRTSARDSDDCFRWKKVEYHRLVTSPAEVAAEVAAFLELPLIIEEMVAAVDPSLYRERVE
jgi:hypothetical protein